MNNFFDWIDKYKFGLISAVAAYVFIFTYLQMKSIPEYKVYTPFYEGPILEEEKEEEIPLDPEQIEVPANFSGDVKNMARDRNDPRERSYEKYSQDRPSEGGSQSVKDLEKKYLEEAGGDAKRARILQEHQERLKELEKEKKKGDKGDETSGNTGEKTAYKGNVMVDWELSGRNPHLNKNWYVRNPGYTCGYGSGVVVIDITVNQAGNVVAAKYNSGESRGANPCMIQQAQKYAGMSRFDYSSSNNSQQGKIFYTFVSQ
jgi:hypothetical protein